MGNSENYHMNNDTPPGSTSSSPPIYMVYPSDQEDSIDLMEIVGTLWRGKWLIASVTFLVAAVGIAYAFLATPVFRAEVVLIPNEQENGQNVSASMTGLASLAGINLGSSVDTIEVVATLRSRVFVEEFIGEENLLPVLFADEWDAVNGRWKDDDPENWPDIRDGVEFFIEDVRSVDENTTSGLVTLAIEWTDAELAAQWADKLILRINERLRTRDLKNSEQRLAYLYAQLQKANLVELRQAISRLIESEVQTITLAQAEAEYAFKIIDPPRVPNEQVSPRQALIAVLSMLIGIIVGVLAVLFRTAVSRRPAANPEP